MHIVEVADSCYISSVVFVCVFVSSVVCLCVFVCLLVTIMSCAKVAAPIKLLFGCGFSSVSSACET